MMTCKDVVSGPIHADPKRRSLAEGQVNGVQAGAMELRNLREQFVKGRCNTFPFGGTFLVMPESLDVKALIREFDEG